MYHARFFSRLLISLALFVASYALANPLQMEIDRALRANCLDDAQTAIRIVSVADGKVVYSRNADTPLLPASIQKMLTTAAALHYLGPEYRFQTQVRHTGERLDSVINGDLVLRGGGDPTLKNEDLWRIAHSLKRSGITHINGGIIADVHIFDAYDRAPSWKVQRSQRAYDAKIGALSLNLNSITVHALPGLNAGDPIRAWIEPAPHYMRIDNHGLTTANTRKNQKRRSFWAKRQALMTAGSANIGTLPIEIHGRLPVGSSEQVGFLNVDNPTRYTTETFRYFLNKVGIEVRGSSRMSQKLVSSYYLYQHQSAPLSLILKELNTYSSNLMAEHILKTMAAKTYETKQPASHADALKRVYAFLKQANISTQGLHVTDGSGLSRQNRFTARAMTDLLRYMYPRFDIGPDFLASLRVMGAHGAHSRRLKNSPAKGRVRAKTGSLNGVSTLAGYLPDQNGKLYAFAFFLTNNRCGYSGADKIEDEIIHAVFSSGNVPAMPQQPPLISSRLDDTVRGEATE